MAISQFVGSYERPQSYEMKAPTVMKGCSLGLMK